MALLPAAAVHQIVELVQQAFKVRDFPYKEKYYTMFQEDDYTVMGHFIHQFLMTYLPPNSPLNFEARVFTEAELRNIAGTFELVNPDLSGFNIAMSGESGNIRTSGIVKLIFESSKLWLANFNSTAAFFGSGVQMDRRGYKYAMYIDKDTLQQKFRENIETIIRQAVDLPPAYEAPRAAISSWNPSA